MADIQQLERALINADKAGDEAAARQLAQEIKKLRGGDFETRAAGMSPTDLSVARSKNDDFGAYLRDQAQQPREGETEEQRSRRLYGSLGPAKQPVGALEGIARSLFQGATFGAGDELVAAGAAGLSSLIRGDDYGKAYDAYLSRERGKMEDYRDQSPITATVAEIGGALPVAAALPMGAAGMTASLPARIGAGAAVGAGEGALYGFAAGEGGEKSRMTNAAKTGALGAGVGAMAPAVGAAAKNVGQRLLSRQQARRLGISGPTYEVLRRAFSADDTLTGQGAQRVAAAGDDAMIADSGPTARALLDVSIQRSGPAGRVASDAIEGRVTAAGSRLTGALDDVMGVPGNTLPKGYSDGVRQAYEAAYSAPIDYASDAGREIERLLRRVPSKAINAAKELMHMKEEASSQILADVADDGSVVFKTLPDIRQLDYITRGLNATAESQAAAGRMGGQTTIGQAYVDLSRSIRNAMKQAVPEYAQALKLSSNEIGERRAREFGLSFLRPNVTRDEVTDALSGMGNAEKARVAEGVRQYVDDTLSNVKAALSSQNMDVRETEKLFKELSSRANREKLTTLLGRNDARRILREIDQTGRALDLKASVAGNSKTFARQAVDQTVQDQARDGVIGSLREGDPIEAAKAVVRSVVGRSATSRTADTDKIYEEIARYLTGPRGLNAQQAVQQLESMVPLIDDQVRRVGMAGERAGRVGAVAPAAIAAQP